MGIHASVMFTQWRLRKSQKGPGFQCRWTAAHMGFPGAKCLGARGSSMPSRPCMFCRVLCNRLCVTSVSLGPGSCCGKRIKPEPWLRQCWLSASQAEAQWGYPGLHLARETAAALGAELSLWVLTPPPGRQCQNRVRGPQLVSAAELTAGWGEESAHILGQ